MLTSHQRLWLGAGAVFATLFVGKQVIWRVISKQVTDIRDEEQARATKALQIAYGQRLPRLKPLDTEERAKLREIHSLLGQEKDE